MFNVGTGEFILIFVLALIILGPEKLPNAARQAGKWMAELRRMSSGFQSEFQRAVNSAVGETPSWQSRNVDLDDLELDLDLDPDFEPYLYPASATDDGATSTGSDEAPAVSLDKPGAGGTTQVDLDVDGPTDSFS